MPIASCPRCNETFSKDGESMVCDNCEAAEESDYETVRLYVADHPDCTPSDVVEATGLERELVLRVVDSGRVAQVESAGTIVCGKCGAPAISLAKRLCEACLAELDSQLARTKSQIKLPPKKWSNVESGKSSIRQKIEKFGK